MFTDVFLITTDPTLPVSSLLRVRVISQIVLSIVFHTIVYMGFVNVVSYVFFGRMLSSAINQRLLVALLLIMVAGYVARMIHVRDIYRAYHQDETKSRDHINRLFISWVFIG